MRLTGNNFLRPRRRPICGQISRAASVTVMSLIALAACGGDDTGADQVRHYGLTDTTEVIVTSEAGDKLASKDNVRFENGRAAGTVIEIDPEAVGRTLVGIGSSFTESSAFVLAHLEPDARAEPTTNQVRDDAEQLVEQEQHRDLEW